ncbi:MAG: T9SS type A sorting domain-containing protein, partial [Flavobacteriia bacterium]|nr:T9SS type A sorting domain-containing protein [Flavobacteriia bacterium]
AGSYTVTYTVAASGGCAAFSTTATFTVYDIGDPCDDGDPETENDMIDGDCVCTGTIINRIADEGATPRGLVELFPNPAHEGWVMVRASGLAAGPVAITVRDAVGRKLLAWEKVSSNGSLEAVLDLSKDVAQGSYLVEVIAGGRRSVLRLVVD